MCTYISNKKSVSALPHRSQLLLPVVPRICGGREKDHILSQKRRRLRGLKKCHPCLSVHNWRWIHTCAKNRNSHSICFYIDDARRTSQNSEPRASLRHPPVVVAGEYNITHDKMYLNFYFLFNSWSVGFHVRCKYENVQRSFFCT